MLNLDKVTSSNKNVELLNKLSRMVMNVARNPQAALELSKSAELAVVPGLAEAVYQAKDSPVALTTIADELDQKSKQLFERPKATNPTDPDKPTETASPAKPVNPEPAVFRDQYGNVVDSPVAKESK
jgi:hypothetical protein